MNNQQTVLNTYRNRIQFLAEYGCELRHDVFCSVLRAMNEARVDSVEKAIQFADTLSSEFRGFRSAAGKVELYPIHMVKDAVGLMERANELVANELAQAV